MKWYWRDSTMPPDHYEPLTWSWLYLDTARDYADNVMIEGIERFLSHF